jgi:undecaprenyl-diphosphatase
MARHPRLATASRRHGSLSVGQALALGLIQGPAELLPVSSSGHLVLVPALLGWPYARLPADVRKAFEVALHTGAGLALLWLLRDDAAAAARDPAGTALLAGPAAAIALALEPVIEEKLSAPQIAAAAQIASGAALIAADARAQLLSARHLTIRPEAKSLQMGRKFAVGLAQCLALVPGTSRNGVTLTAARALGFDRESAARISWRAGLPIIGGATLLKLVRLSQRGLAPELRAPFAVGVAAAFASTLAASPLLRVRRQRLTGAYRIALGAFALRRLHRLEWLRG